MAAVPITNFPACMAQILTHTVAAAGTLTKPITDVAQGNPIPTGRCGRVWYGGEMDAPAFPGSKVLTGDLIGEMVHITFFWPLQGASGTTVAASVDADIYALKHQLRTLIQNDSTLSGNCTDLDFPYMTSDVWQNVDGTDFRTLDATIVLSYAEYPTNP